MKKYLFYTCLVNYIFTYSTTNAQVQTLVPDKIIKNQISAGDIHTYQTVLDSGQFINVSIEDFGIDLLVNVYDPENSKIDKIDGDGINGKEIVKIHTKKTGIYKFKVEPYRNPLKKGDYQIKIAELLTASENKKRIEIENTRRQATIQWLKNNAIPLKGVKAEQGFVDLQPLKEIIGDARIVALGEATHGTREFFQLKHRMLEFLVTEMGFNVFGIEASMPECFDMNDYVLTGKGDPEKLLTGLHFWMWDTQEVLDMIKWMRHYNADSNHVKKVKFYGFDMQRGTKAINVLLNYLNKVDVKMAKRLNNNISFTLLKNPYTSRKFINKDSISEISDALELISLIINDLDKNNKKYINQTTKKEWQLSRLHANILQQLIQKKTSSSVFTRDSSMAENIHWIMEHEGSDAKIVVWAHNNHVATLEGEMGQYLKNIYGDKIFVFGFAFNQGSFQAKEMPYSTGSGVYPFHFKPLEQASLDFTLGEAVFPYYAIDLKKIPKDGYVAEWFSKPHGTRSFGWAFYPESHYYISRSVNITKRYDGLFFINETTSARLNSGGLRAPKNIQSFPTNLDFEYNDIGVFPEFWNGDKHNLINYGFIIETSSESENGQKCVKISRNSSKYIEMIGSLSQYVDATPYLGKKIKLKAAVRTELKGSENKAYLWLKCMQRNNAIFQDDMRDKPINTKDWQFFEITCNVPDGTEWIEYGMALTGEGNAWFDSFSIVIL